MNAKQHMVLNCCVELTQVGCAHRTYYRPYYQSLNGPMLSLANFKPNSPEAPMTAPTVLQMVSVFKVSQFNDVWGRTTRCIIFLDYQPQPHPIMIAELKLARRCKVIKSCIDYGGSQDWCCRWMNPFLILQGALCNQLFHCI